MEEQKKIPLTSQLRGEMADRTNDYRQEQREYFMGTHDDQRIMRMVTQPFWQSLRLSRRRLMMKGLRMEEEFEIPAYSVPNCEGMRQDGANYVGSRNEAVRTKRRFYRGNKCISHKKCEEVMNVHFLKADVAGSKAACPNCGAVNEIASYIDGCDYCGAKFQVSDFETKIAGCSLEENTVKKMLFVVLKASVFTLLFSMLLMGILTVCLVVASIAGLGGMVEKTILLSFMFMSLEKNLKGVVCALFVGLFLAIIGSAYAGSKLSKLPVEGAYTMRQTIPGFSAEDFIQNLDYKLRNIHMTDDVCEVAPFAHCNLQKFVAQYRNVVNCNICNVEFLKAYEISDGYGVDLKVRLRLMVDSGKKIRTKYENLVLSMTARQEALSHSPVTIRQYSCPNCGGSIDLLNGATCSFCGTQFDYSNYGWMIKSYDNTEKAYNVYRCTVGVFMAIYLAAAVIGLAWCVLRPAWKENITMPDKMLNADKILTTVIL